MYLACPFGEWRQDLRQAFHTAQILAVQMKPLPTGDEFQILWDKLSRYLKCDQEYDASEEKADMGALALMLKNRGAEHGRTA